MLSLSRATLEALRKEFPAGTRVRLLRMNDVQAPPTGCEGIVIRVDDIGTIHCVWENGSTLGVAYGKDECARIDDDNYFA